MQVLDWRRPPAPAGVSSGIPPRAEWTSVSHALRGILYNYFKDVSCELDKISGRYSSLQAALSVLVIYYVDEFFLNGRGPILLFYIYVVFFSTRLVGVGVGVFPLGGEF